MVGTVCLTYAVTTASACANAKLFNTSPSSSGSGATAASARPSSGTSVVMARTLAVLKGATPAEATAKYPGATTVTPGSTGTGAGSEQTAIAKPVGGASAGTTYYTPSAESSGADGMLLNYLLGN